MKQALSLFLLFSTAVCLADVKEEFVKKVVEDCGKAPKDAEALATPGRTGNVLRWKTCPQNPVEVEPKCKVKCGSSGNVVGN